MRLTARRTIALLACWLLALLLMALLLGACGAATPTEAPPTFAPTAAATVTLVPTSTPPPTPTETVVAAPVQITEPLTAELKATVIADLPPTPTPETPGGESLWGDVEILPLDNGRGEPLWAAFTVGMGFYDWDYGHTVAIYGHDQEGWRLKAQARLTDCAQYVNSDSLRQVEIEPSRIWLEMESYTGAHGGCYDLFSFDGQMLRHEVSHFNSSPGAGNLADLDGDGTQEVVLNWTENYVFCYACGVRLPMFDVLRWDGEQLVEVNLVELPESAPADVRDLNNEAVRLAQAGLWQDAAEAIAPLAALGRQDPALTDEVVWNIILIQAHAEGLRGEVEAGIYPLLANVFYGDYAAALDVMRPFSMEEIWGPDSPLVVGTPAEGWELALSDWISGTTNLALEARPELAAAHFLRGWALHLRDPDDAEALAAVEMAARLEPGDALFAESLAYLSPPAILGGPSRAVAYADGLVYLGVGTQVVILDDADPAQPRVVGATPPLPGEVQRIRLADGFAYAVLVQQEPVVNLQIIDVRDPRAPVLRGQFGGGWVADIDLVAASPRVVAAGGNLHVLDVSDPDAPLLLGTYQPDPPNINYYGLRVVGNLAYAIYHEGYAHMQFFGMHILDVSDPAAIRLVGTAPTGPPNGLWVVGDRAYVAAGNRGLQIVDVSDPANPAILSETAMFASDVVVSGTLAYLAADESLYILDLSDPQAPRSLSVSGEHVWSIAVAGNRVYVASGEYGLQIFDVSDPAAPRLLGGHDTGWRPD